ncbi:amidase [Aureimonas flava]|uniref:amidase n=1 Tax=Aureimonas flava TaxID=2320271 RepID=UPI00315DEB64
METVEGAIRRVEALEPRLNALAHFDADRALAEASEVDRRIAGDERLPLAGVPVVVKDNIWVEGRPVTQGSRLFEGVEPPCDAEAVRLLRKAGAVILAIGTCSEFACKGVTASPLHGVTNHPIEPALTPGGSSGGPSVAVAAAMAPLGLGTDAGGSSRRPPAHTGIVGFKPTQDVIPYGPGYPEPSWNISALAPIAGDVGDIRAMFDVLAVGPHAGLLRPSVPEPRQCRIALAPTLGLDAAIDVDVAQAIEAAADRLRDDGWTVVADAPRWPEGTAPTDLMALQFAGLAALYGQRFRDDPDLFDPDIGAQIETGLRLAAPDVARALEASRAVRDTLRAFLAGHDLILSATTPCAAWLSARLGPETIGGRPAAPRDHAAFTPQFNHAGLPAISIPCGHTSEGLPIGLQIGAGLGHDRSLLDAAATIEALLAVSNATSAVRSDKVS